MNNDEQPREELHEPTSEPEEPMRLSQHSTVPQKPKFVSFSKPRMNAFFAGALSALVAGLLAVGLALLVRVLSDKSYGIVNGTDQSDFFYDLSIILGVVFVLVTTVLIVALPLVYAWGKRKRTIFFTYAIEFVLLVLMLVGAVMYSSSGTDSNACNGSSVCPECACDLMPGGEINI